MSLSRLRVCLIAFGALLGCENAPKKDVFSLVRVHDGDTITLSDAQGQEMRVDLAMLDAPEREQPFGRQARDALLESLADSELSLIWHDELAEVFVDNVSVNLAMVEQGRAWARRDIQDPVLLTAFIDAEQQAKRKLAGLWGQQHALMVPPWAWRAQATERSRMPPRQRQHTGRETPRQGQRRPVKPTYKNAKRETETR